MTSLNFAAMGVAIGGFLLGGICLYLVHCPCCVLAKIGRRLFVAALLALGALGLIAAMAFHEGLAPLGLLAGLLVVAMLWETPAAETENPAT
ncbi:MAG: hypothetical protein WCL32_02115 [Planctomycetota bacterium]